jgi:hypothetical protein
MSLKPTLAVRLPRAVGAAAAGMLLLGLGGVLVCSPYSTLKDVPIDCTSDDDYDFQYMKSGNTTDTPADDQVSSNGNWWGSGDTPPCDGGSSRALSTIENIPDGGRCGSNTADVLHSSHYNDWGSLFGYNSFNATGAENYEGISFWARAPGNSTKGFTILLDDDNTVALEGNNYNCKPLDADAGIQMQGGGSIDPSTGTIISGSTSAAPLPDQCGNDYSVAMLVTDEWRFYTIPFGEFQQANKPNRVPNAALTNVGNVAGTGLLTSKLRLLLLRVPKEAEMELWIDNLAFYKKKVIRKDAGADADAAQVDEAQIDGVQIDEAQIDGAPVDGVQIDGVQIDEAQVDLP